MSNLIGNDAFVPHPPQMGKAVGIGMGMGMLPRCCQPQTVFPIPQWIPFVGPGVGQHQAAAVDGSTAFGAGAHHTPDLNACADNILKDTLKKGKEWGYHNGKCSSTCRASTAESVSLALHCCQSSLTWFPHRLDGIFLGQCCLAGEQV